MPNLLCLFSQNFLVSAVLHGYHGACYPRFLARSGQQLLRKAADHHPVSANGTSCSNVSSNGYGFGWPIHHDYSGVDAAESPSAALV